MDDLNSKYKSMSNAQLWEIAYSKASDYTQVAVQTAKAILEERGASHYEVEETADSELGKEKEVGSDYQPFLKGKIITKEELIYVLIAIICVVIPFVTYNYVTDNKKANDGKSQSDANRVGALGISCPRCQFHVVKTNCNNCFAEYNYFFDVIFFKCKKCGEFAGGFQCPVCGAIINNNSLRIVDRSEIVDKQQEAEDMKKALVNEYKRKYGSK